MLSVGKRTLEILPALGFALLTAAIWIAWSYPAIEYETSTYTATPLATWACFFLSVLCSITIILGSLYSKKHNRFWIAGLVLITLCYVFVLSLHVLRGYFFVNLNGDAGTHMGYIKDIMNGWFNYKILPYPITHFLVAGTALFFDIDPIVPARLITPVFGTLYIVFTYLLVKTVLHNTKAIVLATLVVACTFFGLICMTPNNLADFTLPLVLLLIFKGLEQKKWQWKLLLLIVLAIIPLFHQVTAIAAIIALATTILVYAYQERRVAFFYLAILGLFLSWFIIWQWTPLLNNLGAVGATVSPIMEASVYGMPSSDSQIDRIFTMIRFVNQHGYNAAMEIFKRYGITMALLVLSLAILPFVLRKKDWKLSSLYASLVAIVIIFLVLLFTGVFADPFRFLPYMLMISAIFAGLIMQVFMKSKKVAVIATIFLMAISFASISITYNAPYALIDNLQNTHRELKGVEWIISRGNTNIGITGWHFPIHRYTDYFFGVIQSNKMTSLPMFWVSGEYSRQLPVHLGYGENSTMGQTLGSDSYVVITELIKKHYAEIAPKLADMALLPEDFDKLSSDQTANKIYDNDGLDIWYINGVHE